MCVCEKGKGKCEYYGGSMNFRDFSFVGVKMI